MLYERVLDERAALWLGGRVARGALLSDCSMPIFSPSGFIFSPSAPSLLPRAPSPARMLVALLPGSSCTSLSCSVVASSLESGWRG